MCPALHCKTHERTTATGLLHVSRLGRSADDVGADSSIRIDGLERFQRIGSGGFSSVYSARQKSLGRQVAVKVLTADVSSPSDRRAFERECQALGLLSHHPNIVTIYNEAFTADARPCIVMELYGRNYRERLDEMGPLPVGEVLSLGVKMSGALHAAHLDGVLHRDLKPHNIFLSSYGEPALGDFGISTVDDERSISAASGLSVAYAAPEVLEDASATVASDVYSLAATLFHLVEGSAPFASKQMRTTVRRILTEQAASLSRREAPAELSHVLQRALAKEPSDRYATAAEFGEALRSVQTAIGVDRTPIPLPQLPDGPATADGARTSPPGVASIEPTIRRKRPKAPEPPTDETAAPSRRELRKDMRDVDGSPAVNGSPGRPPIDPPDDDGEQTIRRKQRESAVAERSARASTSDAEAEPSVARRRTAVALGVLAVVAVLIFALSLGGGGGEEPTAATTTAVRPIEDDLEFLAPPIVPTDIVVAAAEDGTVEVSFTPAVGAVSYEIVSASAPIGRRFDGTQSPLAAPLQVADTPCWKLVVLGERSLFVESAAVCASD